MIGQLETIGSPDKLAPLRPAHEAVSAILERRDFDKFDSWIDWFGNKSLPLTMAGSILGSMDNEPPNDAKASLQRMIEQVASLTEKIRKEKRSESDMERMLLERACGTIKGILDKYLIQ